MNSSIYKYLLFLLFIISSLISSATKNNKLDSLLAAQPTDKLSQYERFCKLSNYYFKIKNKAAQKQYLDSAKTLQGSTPSTNHIPYYNSLGNYYLYLNKKYDSALIQFRIIKQLIDSTDLKNYSKNNNKMGRVFGRIDQYDSAIFYYQKTIQTLQPLDSSKLTNNLEIILASAYNNLGSIHLNTGNYNKSISNYYSALRILEKTNRPLAVASVLTNLGNIYLYQNKYNKALLEYKKALNILDQHPKKRSSKRASVLTNMGLCYKENGQLDTALSYYEKALIIREQIGPKRSISGLYDNIGNLLKAKGEFKSALSYYEKALRLRQKSTAKRDLAASYGNLGLLYVKTNENKKAIRYLNKAIEIAQEKHFVEVTIKCKQGLSQAYSNLGNYKEALRYNIEYHELNDSIHSVELEEKLNSYKQKYESEKKDRLIERLEKDKKLAEAMDKEQKAINEKQRLFVNGLSGIAILLLIILFILQRYFKMKREADRKLFEKIEQLNQQKTLELMKELEMSSFKSFIEGQEKERSRIASDLHDRLGSLLSTVRLHFDSLDEALENNPEAKQSFEFALKLLDNSIQEVRAVSHNLSKGVLTQFGLIAAVENMRDAINATGKIKMEVLSSEVNIRLNPDIEINLFRIIQELITNVIRHAQTKEVFVQFNGSENHLVTIIEDHGVGFDKTKMKSNGMGLSNLKTRIESIGGSFEIDSKIGQGTTIIIDAPCNLDVEEPENPPKT